MTTKHSPVAKLKAQADQIAALLKTAERGEKIDVRFAKIIEQARNKEAIKFAVAMDDKLVIITMPWTKIREADERGLSELIVREMQEKKDDA